MITNQAKTGTPLSTIQPIATKLIERLRPYCQKIEIAGSIRRCEKMIGDIEIVAIPNIHCQNDLFGTSSNVVSNELLNFLDKLVEDGSITKGYSWGDRNRKFFVTTTNNATYKIDLFLCTPQNWGNIFLIRTGCSNFSAAIMSHLKRQNLRHDKGYLYSADGKVIDCPSEEDFFSAINYPFVAPQLRTKERWGF